MSRTPNMITREPTYHLGCRITKKIRISATQELVHRPLGIYHPATARIDLCIMAGYIRRAQLTDAEVEEIALHTLVHELTHWAQYLCLNRYQWAEIGKGLRGFGTRGARKEGIIERVADEVAEMAILREMVE